MALAVTSFSSGVLTVDFNAVNEAITLSNNGTDITLASSAPITGDGATFTTANVNEIVFTDSGALAGQTLTFNAGTTLSLSGGLSSKGVETVTFNNAVTATGASDIDVTAPQSVIVSANLTGGTGGISLVGQGLSTADTVGVAVHSGAVVSATGTGSVTVDGMGGNGGSAHHGVLIDGANSRITSAGGNVSVTGSGGNTGGDSNFGVYVLGGGEITAGSGGAVTITGNGGLGSGSSNFGLYVSGAGSRITSSVGLVSVTATGNSGALPATAFALAGGGAVSSAGNAAVTITADSVSIDGTSTINSGTGRTTIRSRTAGTQVNLGGADVLTESPLVLGLSIAELNQVTAGTLTIGRNDIATGRVLVSASVNPTSSAALEVITARNILVSASITGGAGGLTLSANKQVTPTVANFSGVTVQAGAVVSAAGAVTVQGRGGNSASSYNAVVQVNGLNARITSSGGNVSVTGTGGGTGSNGSGERSSTRRSTYGTTPTAGRPRSRWGSTSTSTATSGLIRLSATAPRRRSTPRADANKVFGLKSPLSRTRNKRTPIGTQPVNSLVAARDPW